MDKWTFENMARLQPHIELARRRMEESRETLKQAEFDLDVASRGNDTFGVALLTVNRDHRKAVRDEAEAHFKALCKLSDKA